MQQTSLGRHHGGGIIGQASRHTGVIVIIKIIIIISIREASGDIWRHLEASGEYLNVSEKHLGGI